VKRNGASASDFLPWYRDGLRFECATCGNCCTGSDGFVWVTEEEIAAIAGFLRLDLDSFGRRHRSPSARSKAGDFEFGQSKSRDVEPAHAV